MSVLGSAVPKDKNKGTRFLLLLDVICLKFFYHQSLIQLFLNSETFVRFLALCFRYKKQKYYCFVSPVG